MTTEAQATYAFPSGCSMEQLQALSVGLSQIDDKVGAAVSTHIVSTYPEIIAALASYRELQAKAAKIAAKPRHRGQAETVARIRTAASAALALATGTASATILRNFPEHGAQWACKQANAAIDKALAA